MGSMWHLEKSLVVCPNCGTSVEKWEKRTGRKVIVDKGKHFWSMKKWRWEWK